jgi:hypothetical protein
MAQYNGYVALAHQTYNQWRNATLGNGYNVDFQFGDQCWDYCALLYWQYGLTLITKAGGGVAADCWNYSRQANSRRPFISITGKENIRRGDILVWNKSSSSSTGHIAFADENYRTSGNKNRIWTLGQAPTMHGLYGGVHRDELSLNNFLGIFRNTLWDSEPGPEPPTPTPTSESKKRKFPWAVAWNHWSNFKH